MTLTMAANVIFDFLAFEAEIGLHDHQDQLFDCQLRRIGVQGGDGAGMAGIDRAQIGEGLFAAQLAQHDAVGPHAQRGFDQILRGYQCAALPPA